MCDKKINEYIQRNVSVQLEYFLIKEIWMEGETKGRAADRQNDK